jgi:hypothetical protein
MNRNIFIFAFFAVQPLEKTVGAYRACNQSCAEEFAVTETSMSLTLQVPVMMRALLVAVCLAAVPSASWACGGPAGQSVAITTGGNGYTVTNIGRARLQIVFTAWSQTYTLTLAPGQSGSPSTGGTFDLPMKGYQGCTAVPLPAR